MKPKSRPVHPEVRIGHVHLKVADLERALAFYRDVLGFEPSGELNMVSEPLDLEALLQEAPEPIPSSRKGNPF